MFTPVIQAEYDRLEPFFSKIARQRGVLPEQIWESDTYVVLSYLEAGKYDRLMIKRRDGAEICLSWSGILEIIREVAGNVPALEVYPADEEIINTTNARHIWLFPGCSIPTHLDVRETPNVLRSRMSRLEAEIRRLIDVGAVHRKGYALRDVGLRFIANRMQEELAELRAELVGIQVAGVSGDTTQRAEHVVRARDELGDILSIVLHLMIKLDMTSEQLEQAALTKLKERFTEPAEITGQVQEN